MIHTKNILLCFFSAPFSISFTHSFTLPLCVLLRIMFCWRLAMVLIWWYSCYCYFIFILQHKETFLFERTQNNNNKIWLLLQSMEILKAVILFWVGITCSVFFVALCPNGFHRSRFSLIFLCVFTITYWKIQ